MRKRTHVTMTARDFRSTDSALMPTPFQNIALDLVFEVIGEERINRTHKEYMEIAAKLP